MMLFNFHVYEIEKFEKSPKFSAKNSGNPQKYPINMPVKGVPGSDDRGIFG